MVRVPREGAMSHLLYVYQRDSVSRILPHPWVGTSKYILVAKWVQEPSYPETNEFCFLWTLRLQIKWFLDHWLDWPTIVLWPFPFSVSIAKLFFIFIILNLILEVIKLYSIYILIRYKNIFFKNIYTCTQNSKLDNDCLDRRRWSASTVGLRDYEQKIWHTNMKMP